MHKQKMKYIYCSKILRTTIFKVNTEAYYSIHCKYYFNYLLHYTTYSVHYTYTLLFIVVYYNTTVSFSLLW